ncbi:MULTISPECIES: hypothetical protein [Microbacterium]|uniref:hypothetical protein n=1 Tax=Microbacterium TaxID=33882 RepID=UPI001E2FE0C5|nr:hypothetical protein [Microbacterium nymphoidis]MCD2497128.1 hypothetical protein [Microbacterium nymphoidis]
MNTLLTRPDGLTHPPQQLPTPQRLARLGLADRLALRIGLWLILRAETPKPTSRPGDRIDAIRQEHELRLLRATAFGPIIR